MLKCVVWAQTKVEALRDNSKGVTAMEYGIIAAVTVVVVGGVVAGLGSPLQTIWNNISAALTAAAGAAAP